jgi:hypothetical protein
MIVKRFTRGLPVLIVVCVTAVFFFPALQGPYSAVNGPVTALQSARAAARLRIGIIHAALSALVVAGTPILVFMNPRLAVDVGFFSPSINDCTSILRC